jgi:hypothetical protein
MYLKKNTCFIFLLLLTVSFLACNSSSGDKNSSVKDTIQDDLSTATLLVKNVDYTLSYKTISLETSDFNHMTVDLVNNRITLYPESRFYNTIEQSDIFIAGISQSFPQGLFQRVKAINIERESIELTVEAATLADAFKYLFLDMEKKIVFSDIDQTNLPLGVTIEDKNGNLFLKIDTEIYDHDKDLSTTGDQIRVSGTIELSINFEQTIDIALWSLNHMEFTPRLTEETLLSFSSTYAHVINESLPLARLSIKPFAVGPIVFTPEFNLVLNSSGKLSALTTTGVAFKHTYSQTFVHDGNALYLRDEENDTVDTTVVEPILAAAVDLTTSIKPEIDFQLFGISGFSCYYEDCFNLVGLVRTDSDQICWDIASKFNVTSQVNLPLFFDEVLEEKDKSFSYAKVETPLGEGCSQLQQYHPVAIAGKDQKVKENTEIFLYGEGSYDIDDGIFSCQWTQISGPVVELNGAFQPNASFTAPEIVPNATPENKTLVFDLEVSDFSSNVDTDTIIVTIEDVNDLPNSEGEGTVTGRIIDFATQAPIEQVSVELIKKEGGTISGITDSNGNFSISALSPSFSLKLSKSGYNPLTFTQLNIASGHKKEFGEILLTKDSFSGRGEVSISLVDAISGAEIEGATLIIKRYSAGPTHKNGTTESDGSYTFPPMDPGGYFITGQASGYHTTTIQVASYAGMPDVRQAMEPEVDSTEEIRLVLSWGPSSSNLDTHLFAPTESGNRFHLFYPYMHISNPEKSNIVLDRDDSFPNGIETVTIKNRFPGTYTYMVHDYTNNDSRNSTALSESGGVVKVYKGFIEVNRFPVPPSQEGNLWEVLTIDGSTGAITPINNMSHDTVSDIIDRSGSYDNAYNELSK